MAVEPREARPGGLYTSGNRALTLDSPAFDADRYLAQLLRSSRMSTLLQKQLEMSAEVKSLDSDMQMLVYENYNKFISATDTIRNMKTDVESMDSKMKDLKQIIGPTTDFAYSMLLTGKDIIASCVRRGRDGAQQHSQFQAAAPAHACGKPEPGTGAAGEAAGRVRPAQAAAQGN